MTNKITDIKATQIFNFIGIKSETLKPKDKNVKYERLINITK